MSKYEHYEKQRQDAQKALNDYMLLHGHIISKYALLLDDHMKATNKANKAMLEENKR